MARISLGGGETFRVLTKSPSFASSYSALCADDALGGRAPGTSCSLRQGVGEGEGVEGVRGVQDEEIGVEDVG